MLIAPLLVGVIAGGLSWIHLPLAAFWIIGYFAFFATTVWLKSRRKRRYLTPMLVWGAIAAALGLLVAFLQPGLVTWAPMFIVPLGAGLVASAIRDERSLWSGIATTAGSCLMTVVAFDAAGGHPFSQAWLLALVLALYFVGTVFYVKTIIRERGDKRWWWASVLFHAVSAIGVWFVSPWMTLVFALLTVRAAVVPRFAPTPKQAGFGEVASTLLVSVVALLVV